MGQMRAFLLIPLLALTQCPNSPQREARPVKPGTSEYRAMVDELGPPESWPIQRSSYTSQEAYERALSAHRSEMLRRL